MRPWISPSSRSSRACSRTPPENTRGRNRSTKRPNAHALPLPLGEVARLSGSECGRVSGYGLSRSLDPLTPTLSPAGRGSSAEFVARLYSLQREPESDDHNKEPDKLRHTRHDAERNEPDHRCERRHQRGKYCCAAGAEKDNGAGKQIDRQHASKQPLHDGLQKIL